MNQQQIKAVEKENEILVAQEEARQEMIKNINTYLDSKNVFYDDDNNIYFIYLDKNEFQDFLNNGDFNG